jgi:hypothetical protein
MSPANSTGRPEETPSWLQRVLAVAGVVAALAVLGLIADVLGIIGFITGKTGPELVGPRTAPTNALTTPATTETPPSPTPGQSSTPPSDAKETARPDPTAGAETKPPTDAKKKTPAGDGAACYRTAVIGGFKLDKPMEVVAGGPNYTSDACKDIHIMLTRATAPTYARSCLETKDGATITACSDWVRLQYPDRWDTLSTSVAAGTRWQVQMYSEAAGPVNFRYTE